MQHLAFRVRGQRLGALVAFAYLVITLAMTWPLPAKAGSTVQDIGDPLMQIWVMRSAQHALARDPLNLYDANAFYPFHASLAYSEEALSTALVGAPLWIVTGNDVLTYNVLFLGSFWLMGFAVFLLARALGAAPGAAFVAGLVAAFAPARFGHLSHLNMLAFGWLPLALWGYARFVQTGRRRYLVAGGGALAAQLLASNHLAVFATLAVALFVPLLLRYGRAPRAWPARDWRWFAIALVFPYVIFAPTLLPHFWVAREYGFERSRADVRMLSAVPRNYLSVFVTNRFWLRWLDGASEPVFPGVIALAGAALAAPAIRWERSRRWAIGFAALLTVTAGILSLGFDVRLWGRTAPLPYALLYDALPPLRTIRGVGRFGLLTALGVPLLAALGYSAAWRRLAPRLGERALGVGLALTLALSLGAAIELRTTVGTTRVPNDAYSMAVYDWLAAQPNGPVAEFPAAGLIHGPFQPIRYMYGSTRNWKPTLAGYSSYVPRPYYDLIYPLDARDGQPSMVTALNVGLLQDIGIRWIVIHRFDNYDWRTATRVADTLPQLRRMAEVGDSVVYELSQAGRVPLAAQYGEVTLPDSAPGGGPFGALLRLHNPDTSLAVARLDAPPKARAVWTRPDGGVARDEQFTLPVPVALAPGDTTIYVPLTTPTEPGLYTLRVETGIERVAGTERVVTVRPAPDWSDPPLALVGMAWNQSRTYRPGDTLRVDVTWDVRVPLGADFAATVQLLDTGGARRAAADLLPYAGMPSTAAWQPGQRVTVGFDLALDPALAPGDYTLLAAIYAYQPGYARVPVLLRDGATATEGRAPLTLAP